MIRMEPARPAWTVLIHEYVSGGGLAGQDLPPSWAAEGHAMRRAVAEDLAAVAGVRVRMTLDARFPDEPGPWEVVSVGAGQEEAIVSRHAGEVDATLIIAPEMDGLLYERQAWLEREGRRIRDRGLGGDLGSTAAAVRLASAKHLLSDHLIRHGVRTAPAISSGDLAGVDPDFPLVMKPLDGAGSLDTWLVPDRAKLARLLASRAREDHAIRPITEATHPWIAQRRRGEVLIQPYVEGIPMSASFLVDRSGRAQLVGVGRQAVSVRDGRITYEGGTVPYGDPGTAEEARRAIEAVPGLRGWVGADFILDERGRSVVLELNPRLTTSFVGLRRLLPPGMLAGALLDTVMDPARLARLDLARLVHAAAPIRFRADGSFRVVDA
jgi:predicted ATP-grasp superfamily ATP-dependent carboligase